MSDRYASPETSRALAEAGLEQRVHEYGSPNNMRCCHYPCWSRFEGEWVINERGNVYTASPLVRALDLTDCLHELTREREGGPLVDGWRMYGHGSVIEVPFLKHNEKHWRTITDASPVEAAALVLLALLKERK